MTVKWGRKIRVKQHGGGRDKTRTETKHTKKGEQMRGKPTDSSLHGVTNGK